jgi:hypothetical protein
MSNGSFSGGLDLHELPRTSAHKTSALESVNDQMLLDRPDSEMRYGRTIRARGSGRPKAGLKAQTQDETSRVFVPRDQLICWSERDVTDYASQLSVESPLNNREQNELRKVRRQVLNRLASSAARAKKRQQSQEIDDLIASLRSNNQVLREELASVKQQLADARSNGRQYGIPAKAKGVSKHKEPPAKKVKQPSKKAKLQASISSSSSSSSDQAE